jgi:hypothetical protein
MGLNDGQTVELSGGLTIDQGTEVAPVDLELFPRRGLEPEIGPFLLDLPPG